MAGQGAAVKTRRKSMFQIGDLILYGGTGVCQVTKITRPNIPGVDKTKLYYVLSPLYQDGSI